MRRFKEAVKQDIIGFLFFWFLLGAGFIWLGSAYGWLQIDDASKINGTVLWLTALAIFWYAYETYQLKKSTAEQVDLREEIMLNEFLPILEPFGRGRSAVLGSNKFNTLGVRNLGKGPAKYIFITIGGTRVSINNSLGAGEAAAVRSRPELNKAVAALVTDSPKSVKLNLAYQDIYGRVFRTDNITLDKTGHAKSYALREGTWDFKRITNRKGAGNGVRRGARKTHR